jgi:exopolysaccharide biosynthesis polyprenyl glycosylphosphotransferase
MLRRFSVDFALFSILLDALLVLACLALAAALRPLLSLLPGIKEIAEYQPFPSLLYPIFAFVWVICLLIFSVYDPSRNLRLEDELASLLAGSALAGVVWAGILFLSYRDTSRFLFLTAVLFMILSAFGWRLVWHIILRTGGRMMRRPRRVLIIGAGIVGKDFERKLAEHPNAGLSMVGFLDDDMEKRETDPSILNTPDQVRQVVQEKKVDFVILALPRRAHERVSQLVADLHDLPVRVFVVPDYFALTLHHAGIEEFAGIPVLDLRAPALSDYQRLIKRAFDLALTLLLLPFALLLMAIIALAVRIDSPGPVVFHQNRAGENGKTFRMHKFRSMVKNAEALRHLVERKDEKGRIVHKSVDDPRVTRLGAFLRRYSLDELPQLFNVLKGEMSLVGPRPEMPYLVEQYEPWQRKRFTVPPGMTGWWQVHGRSDKPMHLHTEEDLYYIQHYSPWLDITILFRTIGALLSRRGAY